MLKTFWGTVKQGKIELQEPSELVEGTQVLVTLILIPISLSMATHHMSTFEKY